MTLMTLAQILKPSVNAGWAVGAYDIPDLSTAMGAVDAAAADHSPIILMMYPSFAPVEYYATYAAFLQQEIKRSGVQAAMVLDHASNMVEVQAALDTGFTGVMIDASKKPLAENIALTQQVVKRAQEYGVSVEAELGHVGLGLDDVTEDQRKLLYTKVEDAKRFVGETGIDALAVAIGTAHGLYSFTPQLDLERLAQLRQELDLPLVLHGSSGTPNDQVARAVEIGISKINVYTDVRMAALNALRAKVKAEDIERYDIPDVMAIIRNEAKCVVHEKNALFRSTGKSSLYNS